ncbi:MAG TPA: phosphatidate cytidylyltransferase, partial [Thermomicrobiales bacterium]|nr:phosphatidate cytidylyltransferase [Thermomicrobiales bacterium]
GLLPAILGGWIFAIVFTVIAAIAFREAIRLIHPQPGRLAWIGLVIVVIAGFLPLGDEIRNPLGIVVGLAVAIPLGYAVFFSTSDGIGDWSTTTATTLYLALPAFAATALRNAGDLPSRDWVGDVAGIMPDVSGSTGGGLAWFLLALLVTWLADTCAYLVGKTWGRRKLIPRVSPNKTIEGAAGGLTAAAITATLCDWIFGMDIGISWALVIGLVLGAAGMVGDLSESMLKRQRGVKDSSNLIPGHGGMLDRIDALVFVLVATWLIAPHFA